MKRIEPPALLALRRDAGIVDQRLQSAAGQAVADFVDGPLGIGGIGQIDLDMILRSHFPRAVLGKGMGANR
jgi:hypothetical protein